MKIYLVECMSPCGDNGTFLIKANTKQDTLNLAWEEHYKNENKKVKENRYDTYYKSDLYVRDIEKEILNNTYIQRI